MTVEASEQRSSGEPPKKKRQRARQACIPCRQRKRKCDANEPCDMCSTYGYVCNYTEDRSPVANYAQRPARSNNAPVADGRQSGHHLSHASPSDTVSTRRSPDRPTSPAESTHDPGIIELSRSRYMTSSSSAAFAQALGHELQSTRPPRLHPFGYSFGLRPEERAELHGDLCLLISADELDRYCATYFSAIAPVFDCVDQHDFSQRCRAYYDGSAKDIVFAAIIAGVVCNASYLRVYDGHPKEMEVVQFAKKILDDPESTRRPSTDLVTAWVLRVMYLRASSSPNSAWFACCAAMHLAEANGLHDESIVQRLAQVRAGETSRDERRTAERYRRIFWSAWICNMLTSYEFGRTPVWLPNTTVADPAALPGSHLHLQVECVKTIPRGDVRTHDVQSGKTVLHTSLSSLLKIPDDHAFIALTKADLCFSYYRRMRQQRVNMTGEVIEQIVQLGNAGLEASAQFAQECTPWFNAIGSTFQYACVLMALDKPATLAHVARAVEVLEMFVRAIDTTATREALSTVRLLLKDVTGKKKRELAALEAMDVAEAAPRTSRGDDGLLSGQSMDLGLDWDQVFDNAYATYFDAADLFQQM